MRARSYTHTYTHTQYYTQIILTHTQPLPHAHYLLHTRARARTVLMAYFFSLLDVFHGTQLVLFITLGYHASCLLVAVVDTIKPHYSMWNQPLLMAAKHTRVVEAVM